MWKPLRGPTNDWPLALCDISECVRNETLEDMDLLYPDLVTENTQVYFDETLRWWYLSNHLPSELLVFLQADIETNRAATGVPHSSFHNPLTPSGEPPRESIEVRLLVSY